jgi:large subunit ribosomal protein L2
MAIRSYRILTPDTRNRSVSGFDGRVKLDPQKKLTSRQHHYGKGRNGRGIITARHRGGGHKRLYHQIDFRRDKEHISGKIVTIEYDPNRSA